jgi:prefoldin subunit 5
MVMTKRKNEIAERINVLNSNIEVFENQINEINKDRTNQYLKTIKDIFKSVPKTDIVCGYDAIFKFKMDDNGRLTEYFTLYVNEKDWREEEFNQIQTSFYGTTSSSEFELDRMINLGIIGKLIRENKENILSKLNNIRESLKDQISNLHTEKSSLNDERKELEAELEVIRQNEMFEKAKSEGITFEKPRSLQVKVDYKIWSCLGFKILSMTPTGKSATIEATYKAFDEVNSYVVKNVRMNYLNEYLR